MTEFTRFLGTGLTCYWSISIDISGFSSLRS